MATDEILMLLIAERERIDKAITALRSDEGPAQGHTVAKKAPAKKVKRHISAEGRARIAAATKERWARLRAIKEAKGPSKKAGKKASK